MPLVLIEVFSHPELTGAVQVDQVLVVSTGTVVFVEFVLGNSSWNGKQYVDNSP